MIIGTIIRIAVADFNSEYVSRLTGVLMEYSDLSVSAYDDADALENAINAGRFDVLLLDPSMYSRSLPLDRLNAVIILAGDTPIPESCAKFDTVRKYQKIGNIYSKMLSVCSQKLHFGVNGNSGLPAAVISFYSPVGGSGKTSMALIAASKLALSGHPTFYMNLESYPSDGFYLSQSGTGGFSALLEKLIMSGREKDDSVSVFMRTCLLDKSADLSENFYYMNHFDSPNDYDAIEKDELSKLIGLIRTSGGFEYIVIDTESGLCEKIKTVFELSDRIVIVEKQDAVSREKLSSFYSQSFITDGYGFKMSRLINFYNPNGSPPVDIDIGIVGYIGPVNNADPASLIRHKLGNQESGFAFKLIGQKA